MGGVEGADVLLLQGRVQFHLVHGRHSAAEVDQAFCRCSGRKLETPIARTRPSASSFSSASQESVNFPSPRPLRASG